MEQADLNKILISHKSWLQDTSKGQCADLSGADLIGVDLSEANLKAIKQDLFKKLILAKNEVSGLYKALINGFIDGRFYKGSCACFCGTIANLRGEDYKKLEKTINLKPDNKSPVERWFLGIYKGNTPRNNQISKITAKWIEEFCKQENLPIEESYNAV